MFRLYQAVLAVLPTGGGKTVLFTHMVGGAAKWGNRGMIMVHRQELLEQTSRTLFEQGIDHGLIASGYPRTPGALVQVAMQGTLSSAISRGKFIEPPKLFVIDECHHANAETWANCIQWAKRSGAKILGVTATPQRTDGRGLGEYFDVMVEGPSTKWLMTNVNPDTGLTYLSEPRLIVPPQLADLSKLHVSRGDYSIEEQLAALDNAQVIGDIIKYYRQFGEGMPAVYFCPSVAYSEHLAEEFTVAGIPAASLDGKLDRDERARRVKMLDTGEILVLTNYNIVSEGFDLPKVGVCGMVRKSISLSLVLQMMGRVLRPYPGKSHSVIIDHVGNLEHGPPQRERVWSLEGEEKKTKRKRDSSEQMQVCPQCYAMPPEPVEICPVCGFIYPKKEARQVEQVDGELQAITAEDLEKALAVKAEHKKRKGEDKGITYYALAKRAEKFDKPLEWADRQFIKVLDGYGFPRETAERQVKRERELYERRRQIEQRIKGQNRDQEGARDRAESLPEAI